MSYDIGLYQKAFLKKAIEEDLGDWTKADPLYPHAVEAIKIILTKKGYQRESQSDLLTEYRHPNEKWGLQVCIFTNEISLSLPY